MKIIIFKIVGSTHIDIWMDLLDNYIVLAGIEPASPMSRIGILTIILQNYSPGRNQTCSPSV